MELRWMWLLVSLVDLLHVTMSMSTCKAVDMEQVKKRRIEAIRGQILSKLRLTEPPEVPSEEMTVPEEILSIYNSTVDTIKEKIENEKPVVEEYYSKQVKRIEMKPVGDDPKDITITFPIEELKKDVERPDLLYQAELRMYRRESKAMEDSEIRVELYRVDSNNSSRYIDSRFVWPKRGNEWLTFDVTESVRSWWSSQEKYKSFLLKIACSCSGPEKEAMLEIDGFLKLRGDLINMNKKSKLLPYLLITYTPEGRVEDGPSTRRKRGVDEEYCRTNGGKNCCVKPLYINFRKDLGWKWIHEPKGYEANYCLGNCPFIWPTDKQYSRVLALYNQNNPGASISPCCVPDVLDPLPIIYYVGRTPKVEKMSNMVVRSCQCS